MEGRELRCRLKLLGRPYVELAPLLGLSIGGLHKQMNGQHTVSKQTEIILAQLVEKQLARSARRVGQSNSRRRQR